MNELLRTIADEMDRAELKYSHRQADDSDLEWLRLGFSGGENMPDFAILVSVEDEDVVKVRVVSFAKFPEDKLAAAHLLVNEINTTYRFAKFTIDSDNELAVQDDLPKTVVDEGLAPKVCVELVHRFASILSDVYPQVMKAIWAN